MGQAKTIGVILSGAGDLDGSELHEAPLALAAAAYMLHPASPGSRSASQKW